MPFASLPAFMPSLSAADGQAARALELLIHTASRTSEVLLAKWEEFDLENAVWTVPANRMKAGKVHRVPLSKEVIKLLGAIPRTDGYLFPGQKIGKPLSNMAMAMMLRRMNFDQYTVHGFRSSFRDWCGECTECPREIAEQALAHQIESKVERAYRRGDGLERRRELMQQWSEYLFSGSTPEGRIHCPL